MTVFHLNATYILHWKNQNISNTIIVHMEIFKYSIPDVYK